MINFNSKNLYQCQINVSKHNDMSLFIICTKESGSSSILFQTSRTITEGAIDSFLFYISSFTNFMILFECYSFLFSLWRPTLCHAVFYKLLISARHEKVCYMYRDFNRNIIRQCAERKQIAFTVRKNKTYFYKF